MKQFVVTESAGERTAWICPELDGEYEPIRREPDPGTLAVQLREVPPGEAQRLERRLLAMGIYKKRFHREGASIDTTPGRELDLSVELSRAYIVNWQGFIDEKKEPIPYSPDRSGQLMMRLGWYNLALGKAIKEFESFFVSNGNGSSHG